VVVPNAGDNSASIVSLANVGFERRVAIPSTGAISITTGGELLVSDFALGDIRIIDPESGAVMSTVTRPWEVSQ
jgi:hypothetical protein